MKCVFSVGSAYNYKPLFIISKFSERILHLFIIKDIPVTKSQCLVFAYGATGAGKTFTMLGSKTSPGITYLTIMELYRQMDMLTSEREFEVAVSHLEVSHYLFAYHLCLLDSP